jgi:protein-S-isoprenylcysteine O-methyltransferase Ste14
MGDLVMAQETSNVPAGKIVCSMIYLLLCPVLVLFLSGDWFWVEGWIFGIWFVTLSYTSMLYLIRKDPGLLAERFRKPGTGNEEAWDRYVVYALMLGFTAWLVFMPLDAKRYKWTAAFPAWIKFCGGIGLLPSFFLLYRSYIDNPFASALVRIQAERKHRVVSTGVYGFVRHPMYLGAILMMLGTPLLLGSRYGVLLGAALTLLIAARIVGEEKMLTRDLDGYEECKKKVKYRLVPFVW